MSLKQTVYILALLAAAGCGEGDSAPTAGDLPLVRSATLEQVEGAIRERSGRPLLLNFWATWCPPCVAELPDFDAVAREYAARGLEVLTVSYDAMLPGVLQPEAVASVQAHLRDHDLGFAVLVFEGMDYHEIDHRLRLPGPIPVTLAFDRNGVEVGRVETETDAEGFRALAERALRDQ